MTTLTQSGSLPNLVIIGAQKCGTTSLHMYLGAHPEIGMSEPKELNFFVVERNWSRGVEWYRSHFTAPARVLGESSPNYTQHPLWAGVPARMHSVIPEAKLIFLVRDPIERIIAHYTHRVADGLELRPLAEALAEPEPNRYICRSQYALQLAQFLKFYPMERILILDQLDLKHARRETLKTVYKFLGVDDGFNSPLMALEAHRTRDKRRLTPAGQWLAGTPLVQAAARLPLLGWRFRQFLLWPFSQPLPFLQLDDSPRQQLTDFLRPDIERFRALIGRPFAHWHV